MEEDMQFCPVDTNLDFLRTGSQPSWLVAGQPGLPRDEPSASRGRPGTVNELVEDIVKVCTAAHRHDVGDLVWLGWNPQESRVQKCAKGQLGYGSQCVAVTRRAAASMLRVFGTKPFVPNHIDIELKRWAKSPESEHRACYVWPPVGSFATHQSECDARGIVREGGWSDPFRCPFIRPCYDPLRRPRCIMNFPERGQSVELFQMDMFWFELIEILNWRTLYQVTSEIPKTMSERASRSARRLKLELTWRDMTADPDEALTTTDGVATVSFVVVGCGVTFEVFRPTREGVSG